MATAGMGKGIFDAAAGGLTSGLQYKMFKPVLDKWAGKKADPTDEEIAAGEHQEDLGGYIVANTRMPNVPGNESGKRSSLAQIPVDNAWSNSKNFLMTPL